MLDTHRGGSDLAYALDVSDVRGAAKVRVAVRHRAQWCVLRHPFDVGARQESLGMLRTRAAQAHRHTRMIGTPEGDLRRLRKETSEPSCEILA